MVADGLNVCPTVHAVEAAILFRLELEKGIAGSGYHAVANEGVAFKDIAAAIGHKLNIPIISMGS